MNPSLPALLLASLAVVATAAGCTKKESAKQAPASSSTDSGAGAVPKTADAAYQRSSSDCARIRKGLEGGLSKEAITPGSWGPRVPTGLQVLPPGGELCGVGSVVQSAVVRSNLFGEALASFYRPVAQKLGCTWGGMTINESGSYKTTHVTFKCPGPNGTTLIHTDSGTEFYYISAR